MADEYHPEFTHVGFSQLGHFIRSTDRKIEDLLKDFRAEGNEMSWTIEALKNNQESMKRRLQDVISIIFKKNNEDGFTIADRNSEESVTLVGALAGFFWKEEQWLDARMNKCCELFRVERQKKRREGKSVATDLKQSKDPARSTEEQEIDATELKRSRKESRGGVSSIRGPSMANENLDATLSEIRDSFSELISLKQGVDRKFWFVVTEFKGNGGGKTLSIEAIRDWQENLGARLNELWENVFETANEEIFKDVMSTKEAAQILKSMLRSLMMEEQQIDAFVDESLATQCSGLFDSEGEKAKEIGEPGGGNVEPGSSGFSPFWSGTVVPETGRSAERMSFMAVETKVGSGSDDVCVDGLSLSESFVGELLDRKLEEYRSVTEEGFKATYEQRNALVPMENILKSLQKYFAEGLKKRATKIQVEVSLMVVELFLLLSANRRGSKFQTFESCLEVISKEKEEAKVVKSILEVLKMTDKEFRNAEISIPREEIGWSSENDKEKELQEAGKRVEVVFRQFINLIAYLDALMNCMGHFETRVLADEAIDRFQKDMKDMEKEVEAIESNMEVLRSTFSYGDLSPILARIAHTLGGLDLQNAPKALMELPFSTR